MTPYQFGVKMAADLNGGFGSAINSQLGKMWKAPAPVAKPAPASAPNVKTLGPAQALPGLRRPGAQPSTRPTQAMPAAPAANAGASDDHMYLPKDRHGFAFGPRGGAPQWGHGQYARTIFANSPAHAEYLKKVQQQYPTGDEHNPRLLFRRMDMHAPKYVTAPDPSVLQKDPRYQGIDLANYTKTRPGSYVRTDSTNTGFTPAENEKMWQDFVNAHPVQ